MEEREGGDCLVILPFQVIPVFPQAQIDADGSHETFKLSFKESSLMEKPNLKKEYR